MIFILNSGSQSIKWSLFNQDLVLQKKGELSSFSDLKKILNKDIKVIGHRVVHGGEDFKKTTLINDNLILKLEKLSRLAPLHNPYNLKGIKICQKLLPSIKQFAIFDTEFYTNLPLVAKRYALPKEILKKHNFIRYGFHGISHEYAGQKAAQILKKDFNKINLITCHLGGGSSITAIKKGKAVDTSMGFTPLEGVPMMTRSGNVDPGIILELFKYYKYDKINKILNYQSGLKAICGHDKMLAILKDKKAKPALDYYIYQIKKYIGSYLSILPNCQAIVYTGTIGYGSVKIRNLISKNFNLKNIAIEPNEELAIAQKIWKKY